MSQNKKKSNFFSSGLFSPDTSSYIKYSHFYEPKPCLHFQDELFFNVFPVFGHINSTNSKMVDDVKAICFSTSALCGVLCEYPC